jgi:uncharacterized membrane protein YkvA (DUF1232 family)
VPWDILIAVVGGLLLLWVSLVAVLWVAKPDDASVTDALRLLPDVVRLVSRLARAPEVPRRVRVALFVLLAYLASPIDLVPDFVPVLGYADDAVVVAFTLRWVARVAGPEALERYWPGTPDGLDAVQRLARIQASGNDSGRGSVERP